MTWTVDQLWRYPIKGIGAEPLARAALTIERPLPLDRAWALLERGGDTRDGWRACRNFLRGAKGPSLMAITAHTDHGSIRLSHPEQPDLVINPDEANAARALFDWLAPIYPTDRPPPEAIVRAPEEGMADAPFASVSLLNLASLRALSQKTGQSLDPRRFRGNLWLEGLAPWEERDLVGRTLKIGDAALEIVENIGRCRATEANPATGSRDVPVLRVLEDGWGHTEFGVYAIVRQDGIVARGDTAQVQ